MNYLLSIALALTGLVLFIAPSYIIPESTTNSILMSIRENNTMIGGAMIVAAYFLYPSEDHIDNVTETTSPMIEVASQSVDAKSD